jgi:hypothetical protein
MLLSAAVPALYCAMILFSGLDLWVYAKITCDKIDHYSENLDKDIE